MARGLGQRLPRMGLLRLRKLHLRGEANKNGGHRGQRASQKNKMAEPDRAELGTPRRGQGVRSDPMVAMVALSGCIWICTKQ